MMRILYIGPLDSWGTCLARMLALIEYGIHVIPVDTQSYILNRKKSLRNKVLRQRQDPLNHPGITILNKIVLAKAIEVEPDIVWVDKGVYVSPKTLIAIKEKTRSFMLHHCTDDVLNPIHPMKFYLESLDIYDAHYTSNIDNIEELALMTHSYVGYNELGFDHRFFKKIILDENVNKWKSDLFFIGHWEANTEKYIKALVDADLPVTVRGPGWSNSSLPPGIVKSGSFYGLQYLEAINVGKIGLGIVSKWNRNQTAARCFEIPACGTMLLAFRTNVLEELYKEGKEAEFFGDTKELVEKARLYLDNAEDRERIAKAGMERCITNKCSWKDRVGEILSDLSSKGMIKEVTA